MWSRPLSDLVVPPTISSFAPSSGTAGTAVTISGNNFDLTPANNSVTINGVAATATASTGTTLTVTVPTGATTGKIAVTVNGQTTTSTTDFTFVTLPGQWVEKNNGLYGGQVNALAAIGNNLFAGISGGGVYLSTNNGSSWTASNTGLPATSYVTSLAVSGSNLFVGISGSGVFLSNDNATSWTAVNTGLSNKFVYSLAVSGNNLYAGTFGGVFLSTNNGANWAAISTGLPATSYVYSLAVNGSNLYAGTNSGFYVSTNNGTSWTVSNTGFPTNTTVNALAVLGSNLFAGTYSGVYISTNNGSSWTAVNTGLTDTSVISLAINGTSLLAGTFNGIFVSSNNGTSWNPAAGFAYDNVFSILATGDKLVAGAGSGTFLSTDNGATWVARNFGISNTTVRAFSANSGNLFAATYSGVFFSANNGTNWSVANTGLGSTWVYSLLQSGSNLFAGTYRQGVFLSANNGTTWTAANAGLNSTYSNTLAMISIGNNLFVGTNDGVFVSTNNGTSWTASNTGLTSTYVMTLIASGNNLFAGTRSGGVFLSTNNGTSWTAVNNGLPTSTFITSMIANGANLFLGTTSGAYLSTNNGTSWAAINSGLGNLNIQSLAFNSSNLLAGTTGGGVYLSTNNGTSWTAINTGLPALAIRSLAVSGGNIYAGTDGKGTWSRPLSDLAPAPTIASFTPTSGAVGASVTITGTNFDPTPANNSVKFNGTTSVVTASTATSITTTVPTGATSGKITVTIGSQTATSTTDFTVDKTAQTITFAALAPKTFGDAAFTLAATASSELAVTYASSNTSVATVSGNTLTIVAAGTTTITASQAGNTNYLAATDVAQLLTVNKASQTITFSAFPSKSYGDAPFTISATASSGLPVTLANGNPLVATLAGNTVTIVGAGNSVITGSQAGNANYNAAPNATQVLKIKGNFVSDSLALVRLYNNTNSSGWTNKTNWLTTTIDKWFGVTLSGQGVSAVNLPNNKLAGAVPEGMAFMQALKTLNLSGNAITSIPDFSDNQVITALNVSNNKLEFGSLEPNKSLIGATVAFNYTNQADIGTPASSLVDFGTDQTVTAQTGGTNNYVWKRNGVTVANADAKSFVIKAIGRANMGEYVCEVTNPSIPGLTIKTAPNKILATALVSGKLFATAGNAANRGIMRLLKKTTVGGYDTTATKAINTDGTYKLEKVVLDDYQLNGFVDTLTYKGALPTWFTNTIYWEEANTIAVEGNVDNLNITSNYKPVSPPKGKGIIKGTVTDLDNSGRLDKEKRVKGCGVSVRRVRNVGRSEAEELTLVAYVFSNENGEFNLPELPAGDYRLNIQYPGYPMDVNSFINITLGEGLKSSVVVAAEVDKGQIKVKKLVVTGDIDNDEYTAEVFPNPSTDYIQLRFDIPSAARTVRLTDLAGKVVTLQAATAVESNIDVTALSAGIYLLEIKEKDLVMKTLRVMKE